MSEVAPKISLSYDFAEKTDAEIKSEIQNRQNFGKITYKNNGTTVGDFQIWVPCTVTYKWGKLHFDVNCSVAKTMANANKK